LLEIVLHYHLPELPEFSRFERTHQNLCSKGTIEFFQKFVNPTTDDFLGLEEAFPGEKCDIYISRAYICRIKQCQNVEISMGLI